MEALQLLHTGSYENIPFSQKFIFDSLGKLSVSDSHRLLNPNSKAHHVDFILCYYMLCYSSTIKHSLIIMVDTT